MTTVLRGSDNFDTTEGQRVLISESNPSNVLSVEFTTGFDSTLYKYYQVRFTRIIPITSGETWCMRLSNDGGSTYRSTSGDYAHGLLKVNTTLGNINNNTLTEIVLADTVGNSSVGNGVSGYINIYNMHDTSGRTHVQVVTTCHQSSGGDNFSLYGRANVLANEENDALQFFYSSGNIDSGTIKLYGIT